MQIKIQSSKTIKKNSLNLKPTRNSTRALKLSQSIDFSFVSIAGFKQIALFTNLALGLLKRTLSQFKRTLSQVLYHKTQEIADVPADDPLDPNWI